MKTSLKISTAVLAISVLACLPACESLRASPGIDGTAYSFNTFDGFLHGTPKQVITAAEGVLKEMDLHIVTSASSGVDGKVSARTALDKQIELEVHRIDDATSKASIRIGTFGDKDLSNEIYRKIKAKL